MIPGGVVSVLASFFISGCTSGTIEKNRVVEHPTYAEDIAPLIYRSCTPCHRPGTAAPFNLITYADVKRHAKTIRIAVKSRVMPPWPADPEYVHFRDEKVLSREEVDLIARWVDDDAPEGDASRIPPPPAFHPGSTLGQPDLVLAMRQAIPLPGDNKDKFLMLKIPYHFQQDTFVRAIEILPGNAKLVHHINAHLVQYAEGAKKDISKGAPFINTEFIDKKEAFEKLDLPNDDGTYPLLTRSVTNFLPGVEVAMYPEGIGGYNVKKEGVLLLDNIHYGPSPVDTNDLTRFNFFFSPTPPKRPLSEFIMGTSGISPITPPLVIPPDSIKKFSTSYQVEQDISIVTVNPHMHLLGKSFLAYAVTPQGDTIRLIRINAWDFRWQYFYTYPHILKIPAGSVITAEGVYDNSQNNHLNPFHPPRIVSERDGSMRTTDEMFQFIVTWMPYRVGDEKISLDIPSKSPVSTTDK